MRQTTVHATGTAGFLKVFRQTGKTDHVSARIQDGCFIGEAPAGLTVVEQGEVQVVQNRAATAEQGFILQLVSLGHVGREKVVGCSANCICLVLQTTAVSAGLADADVTAIAVLYGKHDVWHVVEDGLEE